MTPDDDDEALTWAGGHDPSYAETPEAVQPLRVKKAATVPGPVEGPEPVEGPARTATADTLPPVTSAAVLLSLGVLAGIYLLYTVGWIISFQRLLYASTSALDQGAFHAQQILAIAAPVIWYTGSILLTRHRKPWVRLIWLVAGALLLVPWSFVFGI